MAGISLHNISHSNGIRGGEYQVGIPVYAGKRLVFVTGRGGASLALGGPTATRAWGAYFVPFPHPAPVQGPATLIPWTGPRFSPPIVYGGLSGAWLGWGLGRGERRGKRKNTPRPRPVSGPGREISPGARVLWGLGGPVTNTKSAFEILLSELTISSIGLNCLYGLVYLTIGK